MNPFEPGMCLFFFFSRKQKNRPIVWPTDRPTNRLTNFTCTIHQSTTITMHILFVMLYIMFCCDCYILSLVTDISISFKLHSYLYIYIRSSFQWTMNLFCSLYCFITLKFKYTLSIFFLPHRIFYFCNSIEKVIINKRVKIINEIEKIESKVTKWNEKN